LGAVTKQYVDTQTAANATPPAAPVGSIQFNDAGAFGGSANLTWDGAASALILADASLGIASNTFSFMGLYKTDGFSNYIMGYDVTSYNPRWGIILGDSAAETGGNTGSDFWLQAYNDDGSGGVSALYVSRATGDVLVDHDPLRI
jgi:hypothetical protein